MLSDTSTSIWNRLVQHSWRRLSPDTARDVLRMRFPDKDVSRMNRLAQRARTGKLTTREKVELEEYIRVGNVLSVWHSRAELALKNVKAG